MREREREGGEGGEGGWRGAEGKGRKGEKKGEGKGNRLRVTAKAGERERESAIQYIR